MKRKNKWFLVAACALLFSGAIFCACGETLNHPSGENGGNVPSIPDETVHIHSFGDCRETPATCTEAGSRVWVCLTCGYRREVSLPALGHDWQQVTELEATCEKEGRSVSLCKTCGARENEEIIPAKGHDLNTRIIKVATCTEVGSQEVTCSRCDYCVTEKIPLVPHTWSVERVVKEATCTETGVRSAVCEVCGKRENEQTIPALGHDMRETSRREPTCIGNGSVEKKCSRCPYTETETLQAKGHVFKEVRVLSEPTCTQMGREADVCSVCFEIYNERDIPKAEHSFGDWQIIEEATCTKDGKRKHECENCGYSEEDDISATGHNFNPDFTIDKYPTETESGMRSRHCMNPGCEEREEETPIEPLRSETSYTVILLRTTGEILTGNPPIIEFYSGDECVQTVTGFRAEVTLPTKEYTVKVSGLPAGFALPQESYEILPVDPVLELRVPAHLLPLIEDFTKTDPRYQIGSVLYDMNVKVVGLTEEEDYETTLGAIFSQYKAVLLNMYYNECPYCVKEMPAFVAAYNTEIGNGKRYGDEVACVMLSSSQPLEKVRAFKQQTNIAFRAYPDQYPGVTNIPMIMLYSGYFTRYFAGTSQRHGMVSTYPTTILIDCEGVILRAVSKEFTQGEFLSWMKEGIERYNTIHAWQDAYGLEKRTSVAPVAYDLAPDFSVLKRRWL